MKQILFFSLLVIFLASCSTEEKPEKKKIIETQPKNPNHFYSREFGYSLLLPDSWVRLDDGADTNEIIKKLMGDFYQQSIKYEAVYTKAGKNEPAYPFIVLYSKESFLPDSLSELARIAGADFYPETDLSIRKKITATASETINKMLIDRKEKMMYISNKLELPESQHVKMFITMCFGNNRLVSLACYYTESPESSTIIEYAAAVESFKWNQGMEYVGD
jgi:hypothetical protein